MHCKHLAAVVVLQACSLVDALKTSTNDAPLGDGAADCAVTPTFGAITKYPAGTNPSSIAAGDLDHDGFRDLAIVGGGTAAVTIWHGDGSGQLARAQSVPLAGAASHVLVGDIDNDSYDDLVVVPVGPMPMAQVLRQDPLTAGTFLGAQVIGSVDMASMGLGDINGDGDLDVVLAGDDGVHIFLHQTTTPGTFQALPTIAAGPPSPSSLVFVLDVDGDGATDVVVNGDGRAKVIYQSAITPNTFAAPNPIGPGAMTFAIGPVDDDSLSDLVITSDVFPQLFLQTSPRVFTPGAMLAGALLPNLLRLVDVDGDGRLDLAASAGGVMQCLAPQPAGTFSNTLVLTGHGGMELIDLDGDGRKELIAPNSGMVEVLVQE